MVGCKPRAKPERVGTVAMAERGSALVALAAQQGKTPWARDTGKGQAAQEDLFTVIIRQQRIDNVNIDGEKVAEGGSASGAGDALGAALAILNPNSKAVLNNVDFVNNKAISNNGSFDNIYMIPGSPDGALSGSSLYMYDDYNGTNRREIQLNKTLNDDNNYAKIADSSGLTPKAPKNIHKAVSFERNDKVARIRDQIINHNPGTADITTIQVERPSSTLRPIDIDSSALRQHQ